MSVLIKGMEMPKNCWDCPIMSNLQCAMTNSLIPTDRRPKICPLVEVPEHHGRLIDADALEPDTEWDSYYDDYISYSQLQIDTALTIIEAEGKV